MFSRALFRAAGGNKWVSLANIRPSSTAVPAPVPEDAPSWVDRPERDLVNFPRPTCMVDPPPVRLGFIPQTWFDMFYNQTGVTGPYMLGVGAITFLVSKEIYVLEHEFVLAAIMFSTYTVMLKKYGPDVVEYLNKEREVEEKWFDSLQSDKMALDKQVIEEATAGIESATANAHLFTAKRENVALQLEAGYRQRVEEVHQAVKKRLDYQLETSNVEQRFEQKHMVNWIVDNVKKSITPAQEKAALAQCIADLKGMVPAKA